MRTQDPGGIPHADCPASSVPGIRRADADGSPMPRPIRPHDRRRPPPRGRRRPRDPATTECRSQLPRNFTLPSARAVEWICAGPEVMHEDNSSKRPYQPGVCAASTARRGFPLYGFARTPLRARRNARGVGSRRAKSEIVREGVGWRSASARGVVRNSCCGLRAPVGVPCGGPMWDRR